MSENTLKTDSVVRSHTTTVGTFGVIESKVLATIIGKRVIEVKYVDLEKLEKR